MNSKYFPRRNALLAVAVAGSLASYAVAQDAVPAPTAPAAPAAPAATNTEPGATPNKDRPASARPQRVDAIEITGKNQATEERRNSTAAKIVISREEIEQYGDSNLGDVMRRLPGVTQGGRPGRGGPIAMRGMGGGFTQILLDGQRIPPGFSMESITPEQVERIEIFRAPTAETGTRAIAGTINIILREPLRQTNNDFRPSLVLDRGLYSPTFSWSRNDTLGATGTYTANVSVARTRQLTDSYSTTTYEDALTGAHLTEQSSFGQSETDRKSVHAGGRLQWRLGNGEQFGLQGFTVHNEFNNSSSGTLTQLFGTEPAPYATRSGTSAGTFDMVRLNANLNKRFDAQTRYELRAGGGGYQSDSHGVSSQFAANGDTSLLQIVDNNTRDRSWNANAKVVRNWGDPSHATTAGLEVEGVNWREDSVTTLNGVQQLAELGTAFNVKTRRIAMYLQDEFDPAPNWSANVGLRYETIRTESANASDSFVNESKVLSPLGHLVWRFAAPGRDQLRLSVTQSYRPPNVGQLGTRPSLNTLFPVPGSNTAITPDRVGNPDLKPETAHGIDFAFEHYFKSGGIASVNLFERRIKNLIRSVSALETVSWAPVPRYVSRPQNISDAVTRGVEFDAKFQLRELMDDAPAVSFRLNFSVFDSHVAEVPGPKNRIDSQPNGTANIGFDYKLAAAPITIGGNFAWVPGYETQLTADQYQKLSTKRVFDAFALWTINPTTKLRLSFSNLGPIDTVTTTSTIDAGQRQTIVSVGKTALSTALRLEMRL